MLNFDKTKIILLNPVRKNLSLQKHTSITKSEMDKEVNFLLNASFINNGDFILNGNEKDIHIWNGNPFPQKVTDKNKLSLSDKISNLWLNMKLFFHNKTTKKLTDVEFFELLKNNLKAVEPEKLNNISESELDNMIVSEYQKLLQRKLGSEKTVLLQEQKIVAENVKPPHKALGKYITEESLLDFVKKVKAGIALIEIEYFQYEIPKSVQESIEYADSLKVFDNFYILYSEPNFEMVKEVEKNNTKPVKKDPIVFGVIEGSKKLYFIDDWISDYCKITWDFLIEHDVVSAEIEALSEFQKLSKLKE